MISSLSIQNIALIDALNIEFQEGLNIISGETGAGKSILIDSINFVLGDRADRSLIRHGEETARVELVFLVSEKPELIDFFAEFGLEYESTIIVSRTLSLSGRGDCRINGRAVNLSTLKKLVVMLVDIHAQHENQSLMNVQTHIKILDNYATGVGAELLEYRKELINYKALCAEKIEFLNEAERARQIELLEYQVEEIEKASVFDGEEEELTEKRTRFYNMERILTSVQGAVAALDGDEGTLSSFATANAMLSSVCKYDPKLQELEGRFNTIKIDLNDITDECKNYLESAEFDNEGMEKLEKRIDLIRSLKRKYGKTFAEIQNFLQNAQQKLQKLYGAEERCAELDGFIEKSAKKLLKSAKKMHEIRALSAGSFEKAILKNLQDLGMVNTEFKVQIDYSDCLDTLDMNGGDKIEFLISPNKGEPLKPLQKIASGGELSRFMLALKNIIAELDSIDTLIFDEIDTGISGNIAKVVGQKLYNIARLRQVLVVTHLPQIAAMSDKHFLIEKSVKGEKTVTEVTPLKEDTLINEIIRLTGGTTTSEVSINHAKELRKWANDYKTLKS